MITWIINVNSIQISNCFMILTKNKFVACFDNDDDYGDDNSTF